MVNKFLVTSLLMVSLAGNSMALAADRGFEGNSIVIQSSELVSNIDKRIEFLKGRMAGNEYSQKVLAEIIEDLESDPLILTSRYGSLAAFLVGGAWLGAGFAGAVGTGAAEGAVSFLMGVGTVAVFAKVTFNKVGKPHLKSLVVENKEVLGFEEKLNFVSELDREYSRLEAEYADQDPGFFDYLTKSSDPFEGKIEVRKRQVEVDALTVLILESAKADLL